MVKINDIIEILPIINKKYPRLTGGGCGVFAKIISKITGYNEFGLLWDNDDPEGDPPAHVYVRIDDKFIDSRGLHTKEEILNYYDGNNENGYLLAIYDYSEFNYWYEDLGEGLFTQDYKPIYKEIKQFILKNVNKRIKTFEHFVGFRNIAYSGIILDEESRNKLINLIEIPPDWEIHAHHLTICMGELPTIYRDYRDEEIELNVTHIGRMGRVIAVKVDGFFTINRKDKENRGDKHQHVTIATKPPNPPRIANEITEWEKIKPFKIKGIVKEIEGN